MSHSDGRQILEKLFGAWICQDKDFDFSIDCSSIYIGRRIDILYKDHFKNYFSLLTLCAAMNFCSPFDLEYAHIRVQYLPYKNKYITRWICFTDEILVQSFTSNMEQNCTFEQFESGPKLNLDP